METKKRKYWVDFDSFDTEIYLSNTGDGDFLKLSDAKKEAINYLKCMIYQYKEQIKYIKKKKAIDISTKQ